MNFAEAMFPRSERVLGRRLRPLTLGHCLLLERLGSPFMPAGPRRDVGAGDIALLLWVCSLPWMKAVRRMSSWTARARRAWSAGKLRRRVPEATEEIIRYIDRQTTGPLVVSTQTKGTIEAPAFAALLATLMAELHITETVALNHSIAWCRWMAVVQAERMGLLKLSGCTKDDLISRAKELALAEAAKGGSHGG